MKLNVLRFGRRECISDKYLGNVLFGNRINGEEI